MIESNDINQDRVPTLQELREKAALTQEQLSRRMGIGLRIITDWEQGRKTPSLRNFFALAKELSVSPKQLAKSLGLDVSNVPDDYLNIQNVGGKAS
jgi:transcriptional regulator with XRE-family HTH domain